MTVTAAVMLPRAGAVAGRLGPLLPDLRVRPKVRTDLDQVRQLLDRLDAAARVQRVIERWFGEAGNGVVGRGMSVAFCIADGF